MRPKSFLYGSKCYQHAPQIVFVWVEVHKEVTLGTSCTVWRKLFEWHEAIEGTLFTFDEESEGIRERVEDISSSVLNRTKMI